MSQITIYSSNTCPQCKGAKMFLNSKGIEFDERNIDENPSFTDEMRAYGFTALPLVVAESTSVEPFTGFNTAKLSQVVAELAQATGEEA